MITGFPIDIYDCDLSFAIDTNQKELDAFFDEIGLPEDGRQSFKDQFDKDPSMKIEALTCNFGTPNYLIVFNSEPSPKAVAHEIFHAAYQILHPRGIEDEEAFAYLIGHITEMFYDAYAEYKEKKDGRG